MNKKKQHYQNENYITMNSIELNVYCSIKDKTKIIYRLLRFYAVCYSTVSLPCKENMGNLMLSISFGFIGPIN